LQIDAFTLAQRFIGIKEVNGPVANPHVLAMLRLDTPWPKDDAVPWCSAFVNYIAWLLRLPRSKSLLARSWLTVGLPIGSILEAKAANDVVVLKRGIGDQPGPEDLEAPGHVGFYAGYDGQHRILVLGGNQGNQVGTLSFPGTVILGIRRLA
jgi:uncharacterized protein (TIGR02594 family)